jgi:hypothetical protein
MSSPRPARVSTEALVGDMLTERYRDGGLDALRRAFCALSALGIRYHVCWAHFSSTCRVRDGPAALPASTTRDTRDVVACASVHCFGDRSVMLAIELRCKRHVTSEANHRHTKLTPISARITPPAPPSGVARRLQGRRRTAGSCPLKEQDCLVPGANADWPTQSQPN